MPDCLHPSRFQMDGPADGKTRCAMCELERVTLDHAAGLNDAATLLLRADRAEREVARLTAKYNAAAEWRDLFREERDAAQSSGASLLETCKSITADRDKALNDAHRWATLANTAANERDAARAEVARLREALDKAAQWIELWAHDVDQFSQRTPDGDAITKDDQLKELSQITAALRGQPAPAGGEARE